MDGLGEHCEWNPFCQKILKYYWPNAASYSDITKTDFRGYRGLCDILTGGFPCQPYSTAGKRLGTEDERHLWPHMLRAVREIRPKVVVGENVRGLVNWNEGLVFDEVQSDLEVEGYEVLPFLLPACAVNAPHKRERIWFIAHRKDDGSTLEPWRSTAGTERRFLSSGLGARSEPFRSSETFTDPADTRPESLQFRRQDGADGFKFTTDSESQGSGRFTRRTTQEHAFNGINGINGYATNTNSQRFEKQHFPSVAIEQRVHNRFHNVNRTDWSNFPTQSPVCSGNDGFSSRLDRAAISAIKPTKRTNDYTFWRNESIKSAGNAIVPHVALQIFKSIDKFKP